MTRSRSSGIVVAAVATVMVAAVVATVPVASADAQQPRACCAALVRAAASARPAALPRSALAVWSEGAWREWWRSDTAPARWPSAHQTVTDAIEWRRAADGVDWGELRLAGTGEARRLRAIVVRLDPRRVRLHLDTAFTAGGERAAWSVDAAPVDAIVAVNVGQFLRTLPWGWMVLDGQEFLAPGRGPLSSAIAVDSSGAVRWIPGDALADPNVRRGTRMAFQSYPTLLEGDGEVPAPLRAPGRGVDVAHRDARLALGALGDGRILIVLTRFDALGEALGPIPFGPTVPELAALMGALGAKQAVALDGGISGQLMVRESSGDVYAWRGLRRVPVGLVVLPR